MPLAEPVVSFRNRSSTYGMHLTSMNRGEPPASAEELLRRLVYAPTEPAGTLTRTLVGARLQRDVEALLRAFCHRLGYSEIELPLIQSKHGLRRSGRLDRFEDEVFQLGAEHLLAPTFEEQYIRLANADTVVSSELPLKVFQIGPKFRRVRRSRGLTRLSQFSMLDMFSVSGDEHDRSLLAEEFEDGARAFLDDLSIRTVCVRLRNGGYVDFMMPDRGAESFLSEAEASCVFSGGQVARPPNGRFASIGMYMLLDGTDGFAPLKCSDPGGRRDVDKYGSYGFGVDRLVYAAAWSAFCGESVQWPVAIRPFDVGLVWHRNLQEDGDCVRRVEQWISELARGGVRVIVDDRGRSALDHRAGYLRSLGVPTVYVAGCREVRADSLARPEPGGDVPVSLAAATAAALGSAASRAAAATTFGGLP